MERTGEFSVPAAALPAPASVAPSAAPAAAASLGRARALLYGTATVAVLDAIDACVFYNAPPFRVFRSIAGALIGGPAARAGGSGVVALGAAMHVLVAFSIVGVYFLLSRWLPALHRHAVAVGLIYGVIALFVMQWVIVPSMTGRSPSTALPNLANGILGHAFMVGLPAALFARRSAAVRV